MSDDNLEGLDNASLRKKCMEYGLPNVPITNTSRKLLIRRLRAAITGEPLDKKKIRRETKNSSPVKTKANASVESPKRSPSRVKKVTTAVTAVTSTVDDTKPGPITGRRRSVRLEADATKSSPVSNKRKSEVIIEEDEEDDDVIILEAEEEESQEKSPEITIAANRRSVFPDNGFASTSYNRGRTVAADYTDAESGDDFVTKYARTYETVSRRPLTMQSRDTIHGISQRKVTVEPDVMSSFRITSANKTSIEPEPICKPSLLSPRYSTGYSANSGSSITTSTVRRVTTGGYNTDTAPVAKYATEYDEEEDNGEYDQAATPFLSDFARRLERLRAEPIVKETVSKRNIPFDGESQRYQSSIEGRRSIK